MLFTCILYRPTLPIVIHKVRMHCFVRNSTAHAAPSHIKNPSTLRCKWKQATHVYCITALANTLGRDGKGNLRWPMHRTSSNLKEIVSTKPQDYLTKIYSWIHLSITLLTFMIMSSSSSFRLVYGWARASQQCKKDASSGTDSIVLCTVFLICQSPMLIATSITVKVHYACATS